MRSDLTIGNRFPDIRLPDTTNRPLALSEIAEGLPLLLCFVRGWWCPKEQVRLANLVAMQEEITREYGRLVAVTVDGWYVNGALRAGLGASFPFLGDPDREVASDLDLIERTDARHHPFLPVTFLLDSGSTIRRVWVGYWHWGNPTPDEIRLAFREVTRQEQPTFDPWAAWGRGEASPSAAGLDAPAIWIREDAEGREIWRGAHDGPPLEIGEEHSRAATDGRRWLVHAIEREDGRIAYRLRKEGTHDPNRTVYHTISAPPSVKIR